ncbi:MAG: hypothetical protein L0177_14470, partial [Chloroflexi bacterium]|nr:hypothetical protein [Chloroflexota bacterium]
MDVLDGSAIDALEARPGTEAVKPAPLFLLAGGTAAHREETLQGLRHRGFQAAALEDLSDPLDYPQAPYLKALSPAEQLISLRMAPEERIENYLKRPYAYARYVSGERALKLRLERDFYEGRGRASAESLHAAWAETLGALREPKRIRELSELTLVLAPLRFRPLALEAFLCLRRARHDWLRSGTRLPTAAILFLFHEGDELPEPAAGGT